MAINTKFLFVCAGSAAVVLATAPWLTYIPAVRNNKTALEIVTWPAKTFTSLQPGDNALQACDKAVREFLQTGKAVAVPIDRDDNHPDAPQMACMIARAPSTPKS